MSSSAGEDSSSRFKHRVPMRLGDFSVMDREFDNIRERFDREMKQMEDDMDKFRTDLLDKEGGFFGKTSSKSASSTCASSSSSRCQTSRQVVENGKKTVDEKFSSSSEHSSDLMRGSSGLGDHSNWLQGLESPLIRESDEYKGQKELKLRFDVSEYAPEEIMVKTVDNKLLVHAKHEEKADGKAVYREYNREFMLPHGTDPEAIRSSLSKDGVLTVEAPLPQPAITQEKK